MRMTPEPTRPSRWGQNEVPDAAIYAAGADLMTAYEEEQKHDELARINKKEAILRALVQCEKLWFIKSSVPHGKFEKALKDLGYSASKQWRSGRMQLKEYVGFIRENVDMAAEEGVAIKRLKDWASEKIAQDKCHPGDFCVPGQEGSEDISVEEWQRRNPPPLETVREWCKALGAEEFNHPKEMPGWLRQLFFTSQTLGQYPFRTDSLRTRVTALWVRQELAGASMKAAVNIVPFRPKEGRRG